MKPKPLPSSLGPFWARTTGSNSISELTCSVVLCPTTCSYTRAEASRITLTIQARRARSTSTISENPLFRLRYANPPPNPNIAPPANPMPPLQRPPIPVRRRVADPPQGHIEEVPEEPPEQPKAPGDPGDDSGGDDGKGDNDPNPNFDPNAADPIPNPDPNAEADGEAQVGWLLVALDVGIATCLMHSKTEFICRKNTRANSPQ
jgi:hypothetical protein